MHIKCSCSALLLYNVPHQLAGRDSATKTQKGRESERDSVWSFGWEREWEAGKRLECQWSELIIQKLLIRNVARVPRRLTQAISHTHTHTVEPTSTHAHTCAIRLNGTKMTTRPLCKISRTSRNAAKKSYKQLHNCLRHATCCMLLHLNDIQLPVKWQHLTAAFHK